MILTLATMMGEMAVWAHPVSILMDMCTLQWYHGNEGKEVGWLSCCQELSSEKNTHAHLFPYVGSPPDSILTKSVTDAFNKAYQALPMCW